MFAGSVKTELRPTNFAVTNI